MLCPRCYLEGEGRFCVRCGMELSVNFDSSIAPPVTESSAVGEEQRVDLYDSELSSRTISREGFLAGGTHGVAPNPPVAPENYWGGQLDYSGSSVENPAGSQSYSPAPEWNPMWASGQVPPSFGASSVVAPDATVRVVPGLPFPVPVAKPKRRVGLIVGVVIGVLVLALAAGIGVWYFWPSGGNPGGKKYRHVPMLESTPTKKWSLQLAGVTPGKSMYVIDPVRFSPKGKDRLVVVIDKQASILDVSSDSPQILKVLNGLIACSGGSDGVLPCFTDSELLFVNLKDGGEIAKISLDMNSIKSVISHPTGVLVTTFVSPKRDEKANLYVRKYDYKGAVAWETRVASPGVGAPKFNLLGDVLNIWTKDDKSDAIHIEIETGNGFLPGVKGHVRREVDGAINSWESFGGKTSFKFLDVSGKSLADYVSKTPSIPYTAQSFEKSSASVWASVSSATGQAEMTAFTNKGVKNYSIVYADPAKALGNFGECGKYLIFEDAVLSSKDGKQIWRLPGGNSSEAERLFACNPDQGLFSVEVAKKLTMRSFNLTDGKQQWEWAIPVTVKDRKELDSRVFPTSVGLIVFNPGAGTSNVIDLYR